MTIKQQLFVAFGLLAILTSTYVIYHQAFNGPFIFDDIPNLSPMGYFEGVTDWQSALYFVFGNGSGSFGRVLSMASFLLNDNAWPSDSWSFKYTNTLIHLLNGVLVFQLSRMIAAEIALQQKQKEYFALIATAIWVAHPIQVAAVVYIVQRMTLLSGTFELLACIVFLQYRQKANKLVGAFAVAFVVGLLLCLGVLAKETAVMAIYFIAALELFVVQKSSQMVRAWLLFICLLGVGAIIFLAFNDSLSWSRRSFTMGERLLTESRVLWDYLGNFFLPRPSDFSLFNDDYVISHSLLNPLSTLLAVLAWVGVSGVALYLREKVAFFVLAVGWFVAGHLLESTIIPLEIYFDHRNYLPVLGFCWFIAWGILRLPVPALGKYVVTVLLLLLIFFISHTVLYVWQSEALMAKIWGKEHPNSARAQQLLVRDALNINDLSSGAKIIGASLNNNPNNPYLAVQKLIIACLRNEQEPISAYRMILQNGNFSTSVRDGLTKVHQLVDEKKCWLTQGDLEELHSSFLENKNFNSKDDISYINIERSRFATARGDLSSAMHYLDLAYSADPANIQFPLTQAYWLVDAGLYDDAEKYLSLAGDTKPPNRMQIFQYRKLVKKARDYLEEKKQLEGSDVKNIDSNPR